MATDSGLGLYTTVRRGGHLKLVIPFQHFSDLARIENKSTHSTALQGIGARMEDKSSSLIGVNQLVHRDDGSWHMAKLIQKRENPDTKDTEYYVHYDGCKWSGGVMCVLCRLVCVVNRRMDEWVRAACIESETSVNQDPAAIVGDHVQQEGSERKMTRNMKRRHDEINHVQKVLKI